MSRKLASLLLTAMVTTTPATLMAGDDPHGSSQSTDGLSQGPGPVESPNAPGKPDGSTSRSHKPRDNAKAGDTRHGTSEDTDGLSQGSAAKKDSDPKANPDSSRAN